MDRKQFCLVIILINVYIASAGLHYFNNEALSNGSGCTIDVNSDLSDPQPLLIKPGTSAFFYPENKTGIVYLELDEEIEIYCTDVLKVPSGVGNFAVAKCVDGNLFEIDDISYSFREFSCNTFPYHTTRKSGAKCYNNSPIIEIGFEVGRRFLKVLEVCFDEVSEETYFAKYQLSPANEGYQRSFPRPSFITGGHFKGKNVDALYSRVIQRETISGLIGSFDLAQYYVEATSDIFMARGHLAAKVDFIYGSQQRATFYFLNTAPQWQRFNALNWEAVEDGTRKLASDRNAFYSVYTGTVGVTRLQDYYGNWKNIFLSVNGKDRKIPVPKLYYKMLIDKIDSSGVVLIGVNNPHLTLDEIKKDYIICTDVSDQINYINWQKDDIRRGYSYACDVNEFLKIVPHFSEIDVKSLLI